MSITSFWQGLQQSSSSLVRAASKKAALALAASVALFLAAQCPVWAAPAPSLATINARLEAIAVPFEANEGQLAPRVAYAAQTFYGTTFVTRDGELVHALAPPRAAKPNTTTGGVETAKAATGPGWTLVESFVGGQSLAPRGTLSSSTRVSRFIGNDPARWQRDVPTYDRIELGQPWPGIRVDVAAHGDNVEKFFTVSPGVNAAEIEVEVHGALGLHLDSQGALVAQTGNGPVRFAAPRAYQEVDAARRAVAVRYRLEGPDAYSFSVGAHDASLPLIIDPLLQATYLAGSNDDGSAYALAIDNAGNVIVAGDTSSSTFPGTTGGAQASYGTGSDAFVASLTPDLKHLNQATYLGGSGSDGANALAIDNAGNVIVAGYTGSSTFPKTTNGAQATYGGSSDAFIASLTPDLKTLNQATYLGGSNGEYAQALAIDNAGNVIVAGSTFSSNFPGTTNGYQPSFSGSIDAFVASLTPDLKILNQATYLGASDVQFGNAVAIDNAGNVIVTGSTFSPTFPGTTGGYQASLSGSSDAFVASFKPTLTTGSLNQATYLGGSGNEQPNALAIDNAGNVIVAGDTSSTDFPGTTGGYQPAYAGGIGDDVFIASFTPDLKPGSLIHATYLGGSQDDYGLALAIDQSGNVIIAGNTTSTDFPGTTGGYQPNYGGTEDAFVATLTPNLATLNQATYLGGSGDDEVEALAIDQSGNVIVAGNTTSTDFPGTTGGYQPNYGSGSQDAWVASLTPDLSNALPVTQVPALSWAGLLALGALLALSGALLVRRT